MNAPRASIFAFLTAKQHRLALALADIGEVWLPTQTLSGFSPAEAGRFHSLSDFRIGGTSAPPHIHAWAETLSAELSFHLSDALSEVWPVPVAPEGFWSHWWPVYEAAEILARWADDAPEPRLLVAEEDVTPVGRACVLMARSLGIPSVTLQHGMHVTHNLHDTLHADSAFVYGPNTVRWYEERGTEGHRIHITGSPLFDGHIELQTVADRRGLRRSLGINDDARVVTVATTWMKGFFDRSYHLDLQSIYTRLLDDLARAQRGRSFELVIKHHPTSGFPIGWWNEQAGTRGIRFRSDLGFREAEPHAYGPLLWASDVVIGFQSTLLVESLLFNTPTISLNIFRAGADWEQYGVWELDGEDWDTHALRGILAEAMDGRVSHGQKIEALRRRWHPHTDGQSTRRVCDALAEMASSDRRAAVFSQRADVAAAPPEF